MKIGPIKIKVSHCTEGVYLRWYYNGWHHYLFTNGYDIQMQTSDMDVQVTKVFSRISKAERPTKINTTYSYQITVEGISEVHISGFTGLLLAEKVEQYEDYIWREVEITRGDHLIKDSDSPAYILNFQITRKELPNTPAVYQRLTKLYMGGTLCDLDYDEIVPINKQVNDIAEIEDRQADFTAQFKILKTRTMQALFELSGEDGINTSFPYEKQTCRLVQNGIEIITEGTLILESVDDRYYYVSIMSGSYSMFKDIENLKLKDLTLAGTDHTWNKATQAATHLAYGRYLYPVYEPTDDAYLLEAAMVGNTVSIYGGHLWPFIRVKTIWDEIIANAGYTQTGDIRTNDTYLRLYMPIVNLTPPSISTADYCYSIRYTGYYNSYALLHRIRMWPTWSISYLVGTEFWRDNLIYIAPYAALYRFRVALYNADPIGFVPDIYIYEGTTGSYTEVATMTRVVADGDGGVWEGEYQVAAAGEQITFWMTRMDRILYWELGVTEIVLTAATYEAAISPVLNLPDMSQKEFLKMICNMFGLIVDINSRDRKIYFWNYNDLYLNIPLARDWSDYLSERDDTNEFKFGEYARYNYLKYKSSKDVIPDNGTGILSLDDETRQEKKDILTLPVSTCDEVTIATTIPMIVSRIANNIFDEKSSEPPATILYKSEKSIDPRIVYIKQAVGRTFKILDGVGGDVDVVDPLIAASREVAFSTLIYNYAGLSRLLTKSNVKKAKFNLPVYEVAGMKHYIPIYLRQYKSYYYVNKISNYVHGKLCEVELIKL